MVDTTVHTLSVLFAIISGTGAGILSIIVWGGLRKSPFGTILVLLSVLMSGMITYHIVLFVIESNSLFLNTLRSALYTILAIFLWLVIATHEQLQNDASEGLNTYD